MHLARYGEDGIRIVFGDRIDPEVHEKVRRCFFYLRSLHLKGVADIIPSFCSCLVLFDSGPTSFESMAALIREKETEMDRADVPEPKTFEIRASYGGAGAFDMASVAELTGLSENDVARLHASVTYTVYSIGFLPGFPYLGTLDARLNVPRLETPRLKVPRGSIGIAQLQTGIYTFDSPGGWRIIGRTEEDLFSYEKEPYSLLRIGDRVRFVAS